MKSPKALAILILSFVCGCLLLASCGTQVVETEAKLIPREVVFGNPEKAAPKLSPDGAQISYLAPVNDVLNVWVGTIGEEDVRPVTKDTLRGIRRFFWAGDSKHIMYLQDDGGNEDWLLYSVDIETEVTKCLTPFEGVQIQIVDRNKNFLRSII